jgi:TonB family protein
MKTIQIRSRILNIAALAALCACLGSAQTVKHLTHAEAIEAATAKPTPEYSGMARQLKVQGQVQVNAYITEEGKVERVEAVSGNPMLIRCAEEALHHWKFTPITEDGKPVKAVASLSFSFKL